MKKSKHSVNPSLKNYIEIHENILRKYVHEYGVEGTREFYDFKQAGNNLLQLDHDDLKIITSQGTLVKIEISKTVTFNNERKNAKTLAYRYQASTKSGNFLRYESPDYDPNYTNPQEHHKFHHKHFGENGIKRITIIESEKDIPHISEFLDEVIEKF